jgi:hypothetical protein
MEEISNKLTIPFAVLDRGAINGLITGPFIALGQESFNPIDNRVESEVRDTMNPIDLTSSHPLHAMGARLLSPNLPPHFTRVTGVNILLRTKDALRDLRNVL